MTFSFRIDVKDVVPLRVPKSGKPKIITLETPPGGRWSSRGVTHLVVARGRILLDAQTACGLRPFGHEAVLYTTKHSKALEVITCKKCRLWIEKRLREKTLK